MENNKDIKSFMKKPKNKKNISIKTRIQPLVSHAISTLKSCKSVKKGIENIEKTDE